MNNAPELEIKLQAIFSKLLNSQASIQNLAPLSGGASAETWLFDVKTKTSKLELILRSSSTGIIAMTAY